jgi:hypothetical protein
MRQTRLLQLIDGGLAKLGASKALMGVQIEIYFHALRDRGVLDPTTTAMSLGQEDELGRLRWTG